MNRIHIGCDHAGLELKEYLKELLKSQEVEIVDHGTFTNASVDYPDYAHPLSTSVEKEGSRGILICGSANGVAMAANKHSGIRAAICWLNEVAMLARTHNDANVICIPARFVSQELAAEMVRTFLDTAFEGGRHQRRVEKIACN